MIVLKNREMLIPNRERYIGTPHDNNSEIRTFLIERAGVNGVDLEALSFRLDLEYENGGKDTALLEKEVQDEYIVLTWTVLNGTLQVPGTIFINIRGTDIAGNIKWASFKAAVYAEPIINTPGSYTGKLTELEQLESRIDEKAAELDADEEKRKANEAVRQQQESQRQQNEDERKQNEIERNEKVDDVIETFETAIQDAKDAALLSESYAHGNTGVRTGENEDNSKYYSEQSQAEANRAKEEADRAAEYASIVPPTFHVDFDTMELIQDTAAAGIEFTLDENKVLSFTYAVS